MYTYSVHIDVREISECVKKFTNVLRSIDVKAHGFIHFERYLFHQSKTINRSITLEQFIRYYLIEEK